MQAQAGTLSSWSHTIYRVLVFRDVCIHGAVVYYFSDQTVTTRGPQTAVWVVDVTITITQHLVQTTKRG